MDMGKNDRSGSEILTRGDWNEIEVTVVVASATNIQVTDCVVFFFSSRRRHTRFDCDWSSDVCSSDLKCNVSHYLKRLRRHLVGGVEDGVMVAVVGTIFEVNDVDGVDSSGLQWDMVID